jgi:hypothetical protein
VPTGSWSTWLKATINVTLKSGSNAVRVTANTSSGGPNLDKLEISTLLTLVSKSVEMPPVSINEEKVYQEFAVYPNPTSGIVNIISERKEPSIVNVYNNQGINIYRTKFGNKNKQIDLGAFMPGNYYLRFEPDEKKVTHKIVLVK